MKNVQAPETTVNRQIARKWRPDAAWRSVTHIFIHSSLGFGQKTLKIKRLGADIEQSS
jgi:hypothetical protein